MNPINFLHRKVIFGVVNRQRGKEEEVELFSILEAA